MSSIQSLPVSEFLCDIAHQLKQHKRLVLTAEPGAGKSTLVPLHMLQEGWLRENKILMLEPRRVAAKSLAHYLASQLGEQVGETVGYRVKNDNKTSVSTRLEIVTEGILTRQIQQDPELESIGLIIFDEFHERNLHSDLGLMLVKEIMASLRDDLHCLVMSATIDADLISEYLSLDDEQKAPVLHCPGRAYPVEVMYQGSSRESLPQQVYLAVSPFLKSTQGRDGDILVFLPGQSEIKRCMSLFEEKGAAHKACLLPLYGALTLEQQQLALKPNKDGRQKVIFSTNIAETSLTIEGVSVVIDSGLERQMLFEPKTGMSRLETVAISSASAKQRSGRAGRLGPGHSVRLWAESKQLPEFQSEEINTTDISQMLLSLAEWGQMDFDAVDWITQPPMPHYQSCRNTLNMIGLLDSQGKLTESGKKAGKLPLSPRLASVFLAASTLLESSVVCDLCALLSEKDLLNHFHTTDFSYRLQALWSPAEFKGQINQAVLQQVRQTSKRLKQLQPKSLKTGCDDSTESKLQAAADLLLHGFSDLVAKSRKAGHSKYLLHNGRGAELRDEDNLCEAEWLVVLDINAQAKSGQIWLAMPMVEQSVMAFTNDKLTQQESYYWDEKSGSARARITRQYGAIVLQESISAELSREQKQQFLLQHIKQQGLAILNWSQSCEAWLNRVTWLSSQVSEFPQINSEYLLSNLDDWLLPFMGDIETLARLKKLQILPLLTSNLDWQQQQQLDNEAPETFQTPGGKTVPITYDSQQGPMISVQLQELFGLTESPRLAFGKVPLRFELLSPARRPIQTTSDLAGFWQSSYFEVAKEMRGRYPKHRWPDNPMEEKAGRSIKGRSR